MTLLPLCQASGSPGQRQALLGSQGAGVPDLGTFHSSRPFEEEARTRVSVSPVAQPGWLLPGWWAPCSVPAAAPGADGGQAQCPLVPCRDPLPREPAAVTQRSAPRRTRPAHRGAARGFVCPGGWVVTGQLCFGARFSRKDRDAFRRVLSCSPRGAVRAIAQAELGDPGALPRLAGQGRIDLGFRGWQGAAPRSSPGGLGVDGSGLCREDVRGGELDALRWRPGAVRLGAEGSRP